MATNSALLFQLQQSFSGIVVPSPYIPPSLPLSISSSSSSSHQEDPLTTAPRIKNRVGENSLSEASIVQLIRFNQVERQSEQLPTRIRHEMNSFLYAQLRPVIKRKIQEANASAKAIDVQSSDLISEWKQEMFPKEFVLAPTAFQRLVRHIMNECLDRPLMIRTHPALYTHLQAMTEYWIAQLLQKGKQIQVAYEKQTFSEKEIDTVLKSQLFCLPWDRQAEKLA